MKQSLLFLSLLIIGSELLAAAAEPAGEKTDAYALSLKESQELALQYSHAMRAADLQREVAAGRTMAAWSGALPTVRAQFSKTFSDSYSNDDRDRFLKSYNTRLQLSQPLYQGGKVGASLRAARLYRQRVEEEIRATRQQLLYNVRVLYFRILLDAELLRVAQEQLALAEKYLADTQTRRDMEVATNYDVLRAEVARTNDSTSVTRQRNALQNDRSAFLNLLGLPMHCRLDLTDALTYLQREPAAAKLLYRQADTHRPEMRSSRLGIEIQTADIHVTRAELFPHVGLQAEYGRTTDDFSAGWERWSPNWFAGISVDWTIFDALLIRGQLKEKRAVKAQLGENCAALGDTVRLEVQRAVLDIGSARDAVTSQAKNVEQARESLRLTQVRQQQGVSTYLDVLDARQSLAIARRNHVQAVFEYNIAWADLALAVGLLGEASDPTPQQPAPTE